MTPEQLARKKIDAMLEAAGWVIQDMKDFNRNAALGVAAREFQLPAGPCDYLLFIAANAEVTAQDIMTVPAFADKGGLVRARQLFGTELNTIMDDLQTALVA